MDVFVDLESFIEEVHASVARGNHKLPFHFLRLNLVSSFEIDNGFLKLVLLGVMHSETRNNINLSRVVSVRFLVIMHCLELILFLLVQIAHLSKDFTI